MRHQSGTIRSVRQPDSPHPLRHDQTRPGKLGFDAHRTVRRENAHFAVLAEAECRVPARARNCNRCSDDHRRVDRKCFRRIERWMDATVI